MKYFKYFKVFQSISTHKLTTADKFFQIVFLPSFSNSKSTNQNTCLLVRFLTFEIINDYAG